jgi:hypothetical protein
MEEKRKPHPIGVLIVGIVIAFFLYCAITVIGEGLMNIYDP